MSNRRVMIVDDDAGLVESLRRRMESCGIEVFSATDGMSAMINIARRHPDLVLLDVNMPTGNGLAVCETLAQDKDLAAIPVVVLTGRSDPETIDRCEQLGAHYLQKSPDLWNRLQPLLGRLLELPLQDAPAQGTSAEPDEGDGSPKVLVIDDDPDISKALKIKLKAYGIDVFCAYNGMQGYWAALKSRPDVIICDFQMPEGCGNYVVARLKDHALTKDIPVIFLTGRKVGGTRDYALERDILALGAVSYLTKPLDFAVLLETLREHMHVPNRPLTLARS